MNKLISIIFLCSFSFLFFSSCNSEKHLEKRAEKKQKHVEKMKKDEEKQLKANNIENQGKVYDMQTAKTQKKM